MEMVIGIILVALIAIVAYKKSTGNSGGIITETSTGSDSPAPSGSLEMAPADVKRWASLARQWARHYNVPWQIILAQIWQESWGDPQAVGASSDYGLMQVTPIAAQDLLNNGYNVPNNWKFDPASNIATGTAFLNLQLKRKNGNIYTALEAYNEGAYGASLDTGPDDYASEVMARAKKIGFRG